MFDDLKILATITIAIIGWILAHRFNSKRDQVNKRRDIRLDRLLDAYDVLAKDVANRDLDKERKFALENALTELQVTGTHELISMAANFGTNEDSFDLTPLVNRLRSEIREELGLEVAETDFKWFRLNVNK